MNSNVVTQEQHSQILQLTKEGSSASEIARIMGLGKTSVRKYRALSFTDETPVSAVTGETQEITKDTWTITLPRTRVNSEAELIAQCNVDTSIWFVKKLYLRVVDKAPDSEPFYEVKASLERKVKIESVKRELECLKQDAKASFGPLLPIHLPRLSGNMLEVTIPDLHVGKMAWGEETGYADYDTKIACEIFETALSSIISRTQSYDFEQIIFPIGNDLLNCDSKSNMTTGGTPQDVDSRYQKTFRTTRILLTEAINKLRKIAPVKVLTIPGNHDNESSWHLGDSLECLYNATPDVLVDNSPTSRKYTQFGLVMLMHCHGEKGRRQDYPLLMAAEQPLMFGNTKYREVHTAHRHQTEVMEMHGVRVRTLPSLSGSDYYHASNGYTGNLRQAEAFMWNKDEGLLGTAIYTVPNN